MRPTVVHNAPAVCTATGLPIIYDAAALERRFSQPDGVPILAARVQLAACTAARLTGAVTSTYAGLLLGFAAPGVGPTALEDALSTRGADIREAIEVLGPTFVKFGQALGSRPDLIGPRLARQLRVLQTQVQNNHEEATPFSNATTPFIVDHRSIQTPSESIPPS